MGKVLSNILVLVAGTIVFWFAVYFIFYSPEAEVLPEGDLVEVQKVFGENASIVKDEAFTGNATITAKEDILVNDEVVGHLYTVTGTGIGQDGGDPSAITYKFVLDKDAVFKSFIEVEYRHTRGIYKTTVVNAISAFLDNNIASFDKLDNTTGSTNSGNLVSQLFSELKNFLA